jgi:hypothetical protein
MKMFINLLIGVMIEGFFEILNLSGLGGLSMEAMLDKVFSSTVRAYFAFRTSLTLKLNDVFHKAF